MTLALAGCTAAQRSKLTAAMGIVQAAYQNEAISMCLAQGMPGYLRGWDAENVERRGRHQQQPQLGLVERGFSQTDLPDFRRL